MMKMLMCDMNRDSSQLLTSTTGINTCCVLSEFHPLALRCPPLCLYICASRSFSPHFCVWFQSDGNVVERLYMLQSVVLNRIYVGDDRFSALLLFDRVHGVVHMRLDY